MGILRRFSVIDLLFECVTSVLKVFASIGYASFVRTKSGVSYGRQKNVVSGFLFLASTAALGPLMVMKYDDWGVTNVEKQQMAGKLQEPRASDYEKDLETLEDLSAKQLAIANAEAIVSMNKVGANAFGIDFIKGGPHAHGNLEALLNIGALMHSGLLYTHSD